MPNYDVFISLNRCYNIEAGTKEVAIEIAKEYFYSREPDITAIEVEEDD